MNTERKTIFFLCLTESLYHCITSSLLGTKCKNSLHWCKNLPSIMIRAMFAELDAQDIFHIQSVYVLKENKIILSSYCYPLCFVILHYISYVLPHKKPSI